MTQWTHVTQNRVKYTTVNPPDWVEPLVRKALATVGIDETPTVKWKIPYGTYYWWNAQHGSGTYCGKTKTMLIRAGQDEKYNKLLVLHELAHYVAHVLDGDGNHTDFFWDVAFHFYTVFRMKTYAYKHERTYKQGAVKAYHRLKS